MRKMLLLLVLVFDTATASRNVEMRLEENLMALKAGNQPRGTMSGPQDHFPSAKNNKNMVPGVKRVVMPFYINTYYCWIRFYSECPKKFLTSRNIPEGKTGQYNPGRKETITKSGIRIL